MHVPGLVIDDDPLIAGCPIRHLAARRAIKPLAVTKG